VFLDRDGVLIELVPDPITGLPESPLEVEQVRIIPLATAALRRLRAAGYALVGVSNQPAAAKGTVGVDRLERIQARALELLELEEAAPDAFRLCYHHPQGVVPDLTRSCECRKPAPGMLLDSAAELGLDLGASWMIGDTDTDVAAGVAAGCRTILIENPASAHKRSGAARPDAHAPDLAAAVELILRPSQALG
jgi:D-glycero-D-manno-heptose 1,7-bisphosphate phosphatase